MKKLPIDVIEELVPLIASIGFRRVSDARLYVIKFESAGWRLKFSADRYYPGLLISLIEIGVKEYSLSILKDAVRHFENRSTTETREEISQYDETLSDQVDITESMGDTVKNLIIFFVEKFYVIRENKNEIDQIYESLAAKKLHEIGLKF